MLLECAKSSLDHLANTMPPEQYGDYRRFMVAYRAYVARLPKVKLTAELARALMAED